MCGIAGFFSTNSNLDVSTEELITRMTLAIAYRGPDDMGVWTDDRAGIALGHRRLSIVDLSDAGHQPMHSNSERYVMSFNGEIYNHLDLRAELEGIAWRGHSDTETLLAGFEAWGVIETLKKAVGMFAIALWDKQTQTLTLVRDRFGEKPLYYGWVNGAFVFGSELKALRAFPGFDKPVSREALAQYMRFSYVPAPLSIYQDIYKLEPGCLLTLDGLSHIACNDSLKITKWWSLAEVVQAGKKNQITDEVEAVDELELCLAKAVKLQSLADVPLGAFLSGGVDSSAIVALMQQQSTRPVKTFTVGLEEAGFDESPYAKAVAQHLGTDHSELFVSFVEAQAVIQELPNMYDEPFADSSQIPTHLVCKAARQYVTVALSGDAGDELFGGYNRYFWGSRIWNKLAWMSYPVRQTLGKAIANVPVGVFDVLGKPLNALLPGSQGISLLGDKAHKLAARLQGVRNMDDFYMSLVSEWQDPGSVVKGAGGKADEIIHVPANLSSEEIMMYLDSMTYLPDDILCKVDRASMATSLETRVPFLDHRVAELAWRLPLHMKIRDNRGKLVLRQVLDKYLPRELIERPKAGFGIPVGQWLRGPLRDWAEALMDEQRLQGEGYFYPAPIRTRWAEHLSGKRDHTPKLWAVLMFQSWLEENT
jgi:asparagine synthase (glutamine-hydrolysing)